MPLRQILHKFLTAAHPTLALPVIALMAAATACETDAVDIDISAEKSATVLTSLFGPSDPICVYLTSSVAYTSSQSTAPVGDATIALFVNGNLAGTQEIAEGQTSVEFGSQSLAEGDSVSIFASLASGGELSASARVLPLVAIEQADTSSTANNQRLSFAITMTDPSETTDFYKIDVHRITYSASQTTDTTLTCNYLSSAFHSLTADATAASATGIFTDERLRKNTKGQSTLRLSVLQSDLTASADGADSVVVAVRLHHLSEDYYNFLTTSAAASSYVVLPVFGSATVSSNVAGGYGIVACTVHDERRFKVAQASESKDEYTILTAQFATPPISIFATEKELH